MPRSIRSIFLLAGTGQLPIDIWRTAKKRRDKIAVILFQEYKDQYPDFWQKQPVKVFSIGQFDKIFATVRKHHASHFMMTGKITRPPWRSFADFDWTGRLFFLRYVILRLMGNNSLLSVLHDVIERRTNAKLLVDHNYLGQTMAKGLWAGPKPTAVMMADGKKGRKILATNSKKEWGQALVMTGGAVLRFEKEAGTDAMLQSVKQLTNKLTKGHHAVMVKDFQKHQDRRLDVPSMGPDTIRQAKKNGIKGIFFPHDGNIIAPHKVKIWAKKYKIFIYLF